MPWSELITLYLELINKFTDDENGYHLGPFNALLSILFPSCDGYQVIPSFKQIPGTTYFTFVYVITGREVPVLFMDARTYIEYNTPSIRKQADDQMRHRLLDFIEGTVPIPKLYGISAFGTRICVYEYTTEDRTLTPACIIPHPLIVTDTAPKERWNLDILGQEGEARLKEVVAHIKEMVSELHD
ncbi:hypothetical protein EDC04DRAFT_1726536 [Pisolithus marmoratus]|nr:hypothetical protein EDC04DRAFT_1726536 [Pisolithus marmoratus]